MQFRNDDIGCFTHGFLRDAARNAISKVANDTSEEIDGFGFTAPLRPPEEVAMAIKAKIAAIQRAEQAGNEKRQAVAEGEKTIAIAHPKGGGNLLLLLQTRK